MNKIRRFINQERAYVVMFSLIILFNAGLVIYESISQGPLQKTAPNEAKDKVAQVEEMQALQEVILRNPQAARILQLVSFSVLAVLALGLYLNIRLLLARVGNKNIFEGAQVLPKVGWGVIDIFRLVVVFVFMGHLVQLIDTGVVSLFFLKSVSKNYGSLLKTVLLDIIIVIFVVYFVKIKYAQGLQSLGIRMKDFLHNIYLGVAGYATFMPYLFVMLLLLAWVSSVSGYVPPQQILFDLFIKETQVWILLFGIIMVVVIGPIAEEIFFRGFFYSALKKKWGRSIAMPITASVFAGLHGNVLGFLPIMALGYLLGYMYEKTGSLVSSITIHILHNGLMVIMLLLGRYLMEIAK